MLVARRLPKSVLLVLVVMLALVLAVPLTGAKGNSSNAKSCQKGGWETLSPAETPWTGFPTQSDCVSYGANGGTLVTTNPATEGCLDDGWMELAKAASPTVAFTSQDECITYGAAGGTIVTVQLPPGCEPGDLIIEPVQARSYDNGTFTITKIYDNGMGAQFDWTSTAPVARITVQGGPRAITPSLYLYPSGGSADTGLHSPFNPNTGKWYSLSRLCIEYMP